ncbi:MAG: hypothetical protein EBU27_05755 [Opitutae bacterium]|nr:hypothetical protein [Opitutae bacterium]
MKNYPIEYANVQPHSGSQANTAVYFAMLQPGDKILTMSLQDGGHLTHGHPKNCSGMLYNVVNYGVNPETGYIDYDEIQRLAETEKPKLITVGASAYPRTIDFERMGAIAKANGALLLADIAHLAESLTAKGFHLVSGGSDNHLMLLDLRPSHPDLTGKQGQLALEKANVTLNRNTVPGETRSPFQTSGLRIGTPAVTSRGMRENSMTEIASIISTVLEDIENESSIAEAKQKALALCANFPLPY